MTHPARHLYIVSIGIDSYRDARISNLSCAVFDSQDFYAAFLRTFPAENANFRLLTNEQATLVNVRRMLGEELARTARAEDLVMIFFAGHGSPETSADVDSASRYLVLHDSEYDAIFSTALDLERDLVRLLERLQARHVVVFLDACFSGRAGGRTFEGPRHAKLRQSFRGQNVNLQNLDLGEGRIVISACDDCQVAREDLKIQHGMFTYCLLEVLMRPSDQATISIPTLYDDVAAKVVRLTDGCQHPVFNGRGRLPRVPLLQKA